MNATQTLPTQVREMCMRVPLVITEELLQDLTAYKKDRDRGVRMAARSLIGLFRELAPGMLVKKDRGKGADSSRTLLQFGHVRCPAARQRTQFTQPHIPPPPFRDKGGERQCNSSGDSLGKDVDLRNGCGVELGAPSLA